MFQILVNNAGIPGPSLSVDKVEDKDFDRVIAVNLGGVFRCSKYALQTMKEGSVVINIASTFGMIGAPSASAYCASKGAVINLTRQMVSVLV